MIPHLIHQTWKTDQIPKTLRAFHQTWFQPGWQVQLWTDSDNAHFVQTYFPKFWDTYQQYPHTIQRVDAVRYMWLYHFGGVYADLDMQCLRPLDTLIQGKVNTLILGEENEQHHDGTMRVGNALMISSPGHPFWLFFLQRMKQLSRQSDPARVECALTTTGPHALHEALQDWRRVSAASPFAIEIYPSIVFYPKKWADAPRWGLLSSDQLPQSYSVHHWQGTWRPRDRRWPRERTVLALISITTLLLALTTVVFWKRNRRA